MDKIGINPTYLITQLINFIILLVVLGKFIYKPILAMLEKRRKKIEEGLALTEKLVKEKEELEEEKAQVLKEAQKEARLIIEKVKEQGKKVEAEIVKEARGKADEIIERGKKDLEIRKKEMETLLVKETIELATQISGKLIGDVLDKKNQEELFKKRLSHFLKIVKV